MLKVCVTLPFINFPTACYWQQPIIQDKYYLIQRLIWDQSCTLINQRFVLLESMCVLTSSLKSSIKKEIFLCSAVLGGCNFCIYTVEQQFPRRVKP